MSDKRKADLIARRITTEANWLLEVQSTLAIMFEPDNTPRYGPEELYENHKAWVVGLRSLQDNLKSIKDNLDNVHMDVARLVFKHEKEIK